MTARFLKLIKQDGDDTLLIQYINIDNIDSVKLFCKTDDKYNEFDEIKIDLKSGGTIDYKDYTNDFFEQINSFTYEYDLKCKSE